jgi:hypothetical protein
VIDENADVPSLEAVNELEYWVLKAEVLKTALKPGLFTAIYQGHNTLSAIVKALNLDSRGLLNIWRSMRLPERHHYPQTYAKTSTSNPPLPA